MRGPRPGGRAGSSPRRGGPAPRRGRATRRPSHPGPARLPGRTDPRGWSAGESRPWRESVGGAGAVRGTDRHQPGTPAPLVTVEVLSTTARWRRKWSRNRNMVVATFRIVTLTVPLGETAKEATRAEGSRCCVVSAAAALAILKLWILSQLSEAAVAAASAVSEIWSLARMMEPPSTPARPTSTISTMIVMAARPTRPRSSRMTVSLSARTARKQTPEDGKILDPEDPGRGQEHGDAGP